MAIKLREALYTCIAAATTNQIEAMHRIGGATFYVHEDQVRANDFNNLEVEYGAPVCWRRPKIDHRLLRRMA